MQQIADILSLFPDAMIFGALTHLEVIGATPRHVNGGVRFLLDGVEYIYWDRTYVRVDRSSGVETLIPVEDGDAMVAARVLAAINAHALQMYRMRHPK